MTMLNLHLQAAVIKPMPKLSSCFAFILLAFLAIFATSANAQQSLKIDIVGGVKTATPIAIVPFALQGGSPPQTDIADVIHNDFNRSGKFRALDKDSIVESPSQGSGINFATWRLLKQDFIVVGRVKDAGHDMVQVEYELWDVNKQHSLLSQVMPQAPAGDLRNVAHQISDAIYEKITGVRGAFWTKVAYVTAVGLGNNTSYSLVVSDSDGFDPQVVVGHTKESLLSPSWSPDGEKIAYVSFENGNSNIYVQDLTTGSRQLVESHSKGINGAPAWSPDGRKLAVALSFSGNLNVYVLDVGSRQETRITTDDLSINTQPMWAPDGQSIYFTSDRSGKPQIYQVPASGGTATRISFQGQSNQNVSVSYDGKQIAMVQGTGNVYRIAIADQSLGGQVRYMSPGPYDESPSFAPNASMLLYAATEGTRGMLYSVSADGDVREPSWGPYRER
jgi:TolB protein